jgi:hypothetical protein
MYELFSCGGILVKQCYFYILKQQTTHASAGKINIEIFVYYTEGSTSSHFQQSYRISLKRIYLSLFKDGTI